MIKLKFYNVENIIRIGSCGGYKPDLKLFDIILSEQVFSESNYALNANNEDCHLVKASDEINNIIEKTSIDINIPVVKGTTACTECFDLYMSDVHKVLDRIPSDLKPIGSEMEAFALFYVANMLNKNASCLMSVVDTKKQRNDSYFTRSYVKILLNQDLIRYEIIKNIVRSEIKAILCYILLFYL